MTNVAPYLKALIAAVVAGLSVILNSLNAGSLTARDYVAAVIAFLVALGAVFAVPNTPPK